MTIDIDPLAASDAAYRARARSPEKAPENGLGEWDAGDDVDDIPPRQWILGTTFCRGYLSSLVANAGVGKTATRIAQCLAVATGRRLTGEHVFQRCPVLIVSLEDDRDELRRRVRAAMLHHKIGSDEIKGWLFLSSPAPFGFKLASIDSGALKAGELVQRLKDVITARGIGSVCIDPLVKAHSVPENDNTAVDFVTGQLTSIATAYNCAVDAPHHTAKGADDPGNADRGRGAGSFKNGGRLIYTLSHMSTDDAKIFGVDEATRRLLIRIDSAKVNLVPPAKDAQWFRLVGVPLGNGTKLYPNGDNVQTVEPWEPPDFWQGLNTITLNDILSEIDKGLPDGRLYSDSATAKDREAWPRVKERLPDLTDQQARSMITTWVKNDVLRRESYEDPKVRKQRQGLRVNQQKRPSL